jgi:hypothetical protein
MSFRFSPHLPALACAMTVCLAPSAWAQSLSTKDAWEALNAFVEGAGGRLSTTGLVREGDAMVALNVTLGSNTQPEALTFSFEDIRLEPRGQQIAIIPSATFQATSTMGLPGERRLYEVTHDGEILLSVTEQNIGMALDFGSMQITKTSAQRSGRPMEEAFEMRLTGLGGQADLTLAEPFNLTGRLTAAGLGYDVRFSDSELMAMHQDSQTETRDLVLDFGVVGLGLLTEGPGFVRRAFDAGFSAQVALQAGQTRSVVNQAFGGQRYAFTLDSGMSSASASATDGGVELSSEVQGLSLVLSGDFPGTVSAARVGFGFAMPIIATDTDRNFALSTTFSEIRLGRDLLALLGAADFADDAITLDTQIGAQGRWLVEITDDSAQDVEQPADFSSFSLTNLLTQVGSAMLTGSGSYALAPGAIAAAGDGLPDGEGRFQFELRGGEALLNRLGSIGLIPPDQQFLARMMMNGVGRAVGPDHLQSDLVISRGGNVTVNGMPLPF